MWEELARMKGDRNGGSAVKAAARTTLTNILKNVSDKFCALLVV